MMLVRYGQAAVIAAILALTGNAVWAQDCTAPCSISDPNGCCKQGKCCKEAKCCKEGEHCCQVKKCSKCCPFLNKMAKHTAFILVMPPSLPLLGNCCMEALAMLPHPPLPPGLHALLPPPLPPPLPATVPMPYELHVNEDNTGRLIFGYGINSPTCISGAALASPVCCTPVPCTAATKEVVPVVSKPGAVCCTPVPCTAATPPAAEPPVRIVVTPSGDQLEMNVGEGASIRCKKMTVQIGDNEIRVSRFDDRVRVRGDQLKATADCVRTDGKDGLILEGNAVLHYKKYGRSANLIGDRIELALRDGAMMIHRGAMTEVVPAAHIDK